MVVVLAMLHVQQYLNSSLFNYSVEGSPSLAELDMSENSIGDRGAGALARALRTNRGTHVNCIQVHETTKSDGN